MSATTEPKHRMKIVVQRSGLSPHVIRVWEKRYDAVEPKRSETNRRLYSDDDISRLTLLRVLTESGHSIGQIAALTTLQLRDLARQATDSEGELFHALNRGSEGKVADGIAEKEGSAPDTDLFLEQALVACRAMDQQDLETVIDRAVVAFGYSGFVENLAGPLITAIGEEWHAGTMTAAQEHASTATIRAQIEKHVRVFPLGEKAPRIVVTTPAGQLHELGAVLAAAVARRIGWRDIYLGPSLPAGEIAGAVIQSEAIVLALSISHPADDPGLAEELQLLRKLVGDDVVILAGGRVAPAYREVLEEAKIELLASLGDLRQRLEDMRQTPREA